MEFVTLNMSVAGEVNTSRTSGIITKRIAVQRATLQENIYMLISGLQKRPFNNTLLGKAYW